MDTLASVVGLGTLGMAVAGPLLLVATSKAPSLLAKLLGLGGASSAPSATSNTSTATSSSVQGGPGNGGSKYLRKGTAAGRGTGGGIWELEDMDDGKDEVYGVGGLVVLAGRSGARGGGPGGTRDLPLYLSPGSGSHACMPSSSPASSSSSSYNMAHGGRGGFDHHGPSSASEPGFWYDYNPSAASVVHNTHFTTMVQSATLRDKYDVVSPLSVFVTECQGARSHWEDRNAVRFIRNALAVVLCDGHGRENFGSVAAAFCCDFCMEKLLDAPIDAFDTIGGTTTAIREAMAATEASFTQTAPSFKAGTTMLVAVFTTTHIVIANAGDCRAVLCRQDVAIPLSQDHKLGVPSEAQRVLRQGGRVEQPEMGGPYRIYTDGGQGGLAVSRALGDSFLKLPPYVAQPLVDATPDITCTAWRPGLEQFVVLASDGLWDVMTSQNACDIVIGVPAGQSPSAALTRYARDAGSGDNMTVIVVSLGGR